MKKMWILVLAAVLCLTCLLPGRAEAAEIIDSGKCGKRVTWTLDSDWTLTISGKGDMENYFRGTDVPWDKYYMEIQKIVVEEGVTSIGYYAFENLHSVHQVQLPNTITMIQTYAFSSCTSLRTITLPNSLTTIAHDAFLRCGLTSVSIPDSVKEIGYSAFAQCYRLTSVTIPAGVEKLGTGIFASCTSLESIVVEWDRVPASTFKGCTMLQSVTLRDTVKEIGSSAFADCSALGTIVVPDSVTSIAVGAFGGCHQLGCVYLSKNLQTVGAGILSGKGLRHILYGGDRDSWYTLGIMKDLASEVPVTVHLNASAGDLSVVRTCSIEAVHCAVCQDMAYYNMRAAAKHNFEYSVCTICGVEDHWTYRIDGDGWMTLTGSSEKLEELVIPGVIEGYTVHEIGREAFKGHSEIRSIVIGEGVERVGIWAFYSCSNVESVSLPQSLRTIGEYSFDGNGKLKELVLPDGVQEIGKSSFTHCGSMTRVTIPAALTTIGEDAFRWCKGLEGVYITDLSAWMKIQMTNSDSNPLKLARTLYLNGEPISYLQIPEGTQNVAKYIFLGCDMESVSIPASVTSISQGAFYDCQNLTHVVYDGTAESWAAVAVGSDNRPLTETQIHYGLTVEVTEGTCAQPGNETHTCQTCGGILMRKQLPATDHDWGDWVETAAPTAQTDGQRTRQCLLCGKSDTETIDNNPFTDVKQDRFEEAILWAYYADITSGTGDGTTFSPENTCTRKQIVTFLWRAAGEPEPASMANPFTDVKQDRFEKAILWAYYEGITSGTGDGTTFSPESTCTRKQIVTFLWRAAGEPEPASMANPFRDVKSDSFEKAILWAFYRGITSGTGDGTAFSPENACTRKQIVTFLWRAEKDGAVMPADPVQLVGDAYALEEGKSLPYTAALTGKVIEVLEAWNADKGTVSVVIAVEGCEGQPVLCYRMKGNGAKDVAYSDTVTVIGTLENYGGTVQFASGCLLAEMTKGEGGHSTDPGVILRAASALEYGETLPYEVTLTGKVSSIYEQASESNGGADVDITVEGYGQYTVNCFRLTGDAVKNLHAGDVLIVTGILQNKGDVLVFVSGSTCVRG